MLTCGALSASIVGIAYLYGVLLENYPAARAYTRPHLCST